MNEDETSNPNLLNVNEVAEFLGVNVGAVRRWVCSRGLPGLNVGIRGN